MSSKERAAKLGKEIEGHILKFPVKKATVTEDGQVKLEFQDYTICLWVCGYTITS